MMLFCGITVCELVWYITLVHESPMHTSPILPLRLDSQHFPCCTPPFTLACFAFFWLTVDFDSLCNASVYSVHSRFLIIVIRLRGIGNGWHRCRAHFTQCGIIFYKYTCFRYHSYTVSLCLSLFQVVLHGNHSHIHHHTLVCSSIYYLTRLSTIAKIWSSLVCYC